jgi:hypothetical protein
LQGKPPGCPCPQAIISGAKVIPRPFVPQGRRPPGFGKNLHTSLRSGSIFPKSLAGQGHGIEKAPEIIACVQQTYQIIILRFKYMNSKVNGFILPCDKTGKDRGKAAYANAFIGFGVSFRRPSTAIYLQDARNAGLPVNEETVPDSGTVAFVSVASEGVHNAKTVELAQKVIAGGGAVIMDAGGTGFGKSHSRYSINGGEKVQDMLGRPTGQTREGYNVWGNLHNIRQNIERL